MNEQQDNKELEGKNTLFLYLIFTKEVIQKIGGIYGKKYYTEEIS